MAKLALAAIERGFPALKIRFGRPRLADDLDTLAAVRAAVGDRLELMVDCNQGWRMPWDTKAPWTVGEALEVARELEKQNVYWMEEPLHRGDYDGYAALRRQTPVRIAGGEMTRERYEFDELLARECLDVVQPDVACSLGMEGLRKLVQAVEAHGKVFTPHTWGNGIGLAANLHLTAGAAAAPFIEFPYDPPEWSIERRDFMLQHPIDIDAEGWLNLSDAPGLGLDIDEAALDATLAKRSTYA
jgi:L-alanine-DL-glutamate epimerase-like enolase superfamily enzyme